MNNNDSCNHSTASCQTANCVQTERAAAYAAWEKQGRSLGKPTTSFTVDELQTLFSANWQPFYQTNGKPYCQAYIRHPRECLIASVEDILYWECLLDEARYDEAKACLCRKLNAMSHDEIMHLIRVMDGFWYNCDTAAEEDFFNVEENV